MGIGFTTETPGIPFVLRARFLAMPIVALVLVLLEPACVSLDTREEPIASQHSALGASLLGHATKVSAGYSHTCALLATGGIVCWGQGAYNQLGNGSTDASDVPVVVSGLSDAVDVAAGAYHTCAVRQTGELVCWGWNGIGQPPNGSSGTSPLPVAIAGVTDAVAVAASAYQTCAVRVTGQVVCWGDGAYGRLGNGSTASSNVPIAVSGLTDAVSVAAGYYNTCAARRTGGVACWGRGFFGVLGSGKSADSGVPVDVSALTDAVDVGVGSLHACATRRTGEVVCWGHNGSGQLGNGSATSPSLPIAVTGLTGVTAVTAGGNHACAAVGTGAVFCWGYGADGELGNGSGASSSLPVAVTGLTDATQVVTGGSGLGSGDGLLEDGDHSCAVHGTGAVFCWGSGSNGELGNGSAVSSSVPVIVLGLGDNIGQPCSGATECVSGFCADGVCCDYACGGDNLTDCQACSVAAGAPANGTCGVAPATKVCYTRAHLCDSADEVLTCTGTTAACPVPAPWSPLACTSLPTGQPPVATVDLLGGTNVVGGLTLAFEGGLTSSGDISVGTCDAQSLPPTGFRIVESRTGRFCWNIDTSPDCSVTPSACPYAPKIQVCIHYDASAATNEDSLDLYHDDGRGYLPATTSLCKSNGCVGNRLCPWCCEPCANPARICGTADSLSPFAIVEPLDARPPVFSNVPGTIVAFASSTNGAKVTYALPKATDAVDDALSVSCSRASGTTFPVGKTIVSCTAADKSGNRSRATFTVWVQYQAPTDGTFFLKPIRSDGSSIFRIGKAVPVKFQLMGASAGITNLVAKLVVTKTSTAVRGTVEDVGDEEGEDTDFVFKYRPGKNLYSYRWKTRGETQGTYQLRADLGDGVVHQVNVSLKAPR